MQATILSAWQSIEQAWFTDEDSPSLILDQVNGFLDSVGFTQNFVDKMRRMPPGARPKVIKDLIWGMVAVDSAAMVLLDCPLLQRLRRIRQLGFTYLVYPSATHTRFEHSLGVYHVASEYLRRICDKECDRPDLSEEHKWKYPDQRLQTDIRHAALLHDIGHLPYSHVVESICQSAAGQFSVGEISIDEFLLPAQTRFRNHPFYEHLAEVIAVAIILSPRFKTFYNEVVRRADPEANYRVASLIAGVPHDVNYPAAAQLISGAVDCDKIDYLRRDAELCNIPIGIDSSRLFMQAGFVSCPVHALPDTLMTKRFETQRPVVLLVLNSSGIDTVEEAAFGRARLYERVYRHSVTRNAERLMGKAVEIVLSNDAMPAEFCHQLFHLLSYTDEAFIETLKRYSADTTASILACRLHNRTLPKRAIVFGPLISQPLIPLSDLFGDQLKHDPEPARSVRKQLLVGTVEKLKESRGLFSTLTGHREFEERIARKAEELRDLLADQGQGSLPQGACEVQIVPLPHLAHIIEKCPVLEKDGRIASSGDYTKVDELVSADEVAKTMGSVNCETKWRELVFLASKEVLYSLFDANSAPLDLPGIGPIHGKFRFLLDDELAMRRSKVDGHQLRRYQARLSEASHFDVRPRLDGEQKRTMQIDTLAKKFATFRGAQSWEVNASTICAFLNQIPRKFRNDAMALLESVLFLGRQQLKDYADAAINKIGNAAGGTGALILAPLTYNSGALVSMLFEQDKLSSFSRRTLKRAKTLNQALGLAQPQDSIILLDDNVSSGSQALAQLLAWIGIQRASWPEEIQMERGIEDRQLSPNDLTTLQNVNLWIAACVGGDGAENYIRTHINARLPKFRGFHRGIALGEITAGAHSVQSEFVEYLKRVGRNCLETCRLRDDTGGDRYRIIVSAERDAYGYSGAGALLVTMFNVPTPTVTALWCPGEVDGEPWFPLFIRRGYLGHLTVA